jgi:TrmH family RNA methyltransferase
MSLQISKNEIKRLRSLHRKKGRRESGLFIVEGEKNVEELCVSSLEVQTIYVTDEWKGGLAGNRKPLVISAKDMVAISALHSSSPILAVAAVPVNVPWQPERVAGSKLLVLDDLKDPGNVGTILRTADWFGLEHVLLSETCVDEFNPKVVQSTMGSLFRLKVYRGDIGKYLASLKEHNPTFRVVAADMQGDELSTLRAPTCGALVIGSESHGVSESVLQHCESKVTIPRMGGAESLNAGIAAGILMYVWSF